MSLGRWLTPIAASAAVLATLLVPGALTAGARTGTGPDEPDDVAPDRRLLPVPYDGGPDIAITSYQSIGRQLTVFYTVANRADCSSDVRAPSVAETRGSVAVRLKRVPGGQPEDSCTAGRLTSAVRITLGRELAGRVVQDAGRRGALVPIQRPYRSVS